MKIGKFNKFCGYKGTIEYDYETDRFYGELIGVKYKTLYEADTVEELYENFRKIAKGYSRIIEE